MSRQRHEVQVLFPSFVVMKNIISALIVLVLSSCNVGLESTADQSKPTRDHELTDTTCGYAKVQITQEIKKGALHEYKQYYFLDGSIAMQGEFIDFKKENWWEEFHAAGKVKSRGSYANDLKQGEWLYYFENSGLQSIGSFDNDQMTGWWKHFNNRNQIISEGNYFPGKKTGFWITYENETTHTEGKYENGEAVGLWKYYDKQGKLESTFDFE